MIPTLLCVVGVALGVAAQLWFRHRDRKKPEAACKVVSSSLLLVTVLLQPATETWAWVLAGMALSWAGDILMIGQARRWLAGGLVAFLLAHVFYLIAAASRVELVKVPAVGMSLILIVVLFAGVVTFDRVWPFLGRLRIPSILYFAVLGLMTVAALCAWLTEPGERSRQVFALGAALFFASDAAVAHQRFVGRSFRTRLWGLPCYFSGQLMLAVSVGMV